MPVHKYRDVSEMPDGAWREKASRELYRAIRTTWDFARRTTRPSFPPGVYKHRSIEEAERLRSVWEQQNFEAHRERLERRRRRRGE